MNTSTDKWYEANQRYLMAALGIVRGELGRYRSKAESHAGDNDGTTKELSNERKRLNRAAGNLPAPAALERLTGLFGLTTFERGILLMCAGIELDSDFAELCASARGDSLSPFPNFSLALAALSEAHWSALLPNAPLRYWRLIEVTGAEPLTRANLRIDERILHYLAGISHMDERLAGIAEPLIVEGELVPSHRKLADRLVRAWSQESGRSAFPVIQLCGDEAAGKRSVAFSGCSKLGFNISAISALALPNSTAELETLIRLWEREAALSTSVLFFDCDDIDKSDISRLAIFNRFCDRTRGRLIISCRERFLISRRQTIVLEVGKPTSDEQRVAWKNFLGPKGYDLDGQLETMVSQFNLSTQTILFASSGALRNASQDGSGDGESRKDLGSLIWDACREQTRPRLDDLAQRIKPAAAWDDLVLPGQQKQILREIAIHVRQRSKVYGAWGFAARSERGLGISALFTGDSGTGKTMAAEVLANELHLDLYRIDLSQVVNKYIGETEKNLRRVFDAAEEGGVILLFDEADSLFGKRSEVKDSHDRYANIEVSYLLQRMEGYRGLAILTTNMKSALDKAFLRRIRFIVQFPFPDAAQRARIWGRIFPAATPTEGLDVDKLARLNIAGGNIRNIALNAAFLAASDGGQVRMKHLLQAARGEYAKLERPLATSEIGGWDEE